MAARGDKPAEAQGIRFLEFKPINLPTACTKISDVLARSDDEGISPDDLDELKQDFVCLQELLQKRCQQLSEESEALAEHAERPALPNAGPVDRKKSSSSSSSVSASHKRREPDIGSRLSADAKRVKVCASESSSTANSPSPATANSQTRKNGAESSNDKKSKIKSKPSKSDQLESELQLAKAKQDTANKFWSAVEQYCAPITENDIRIVRQAIAVPDEDLGLQKVPPLGRHYSFQWAQEDLSREDSQAECPNSNDKGMKTSLSTTGDNFHVQVDGISLPHDVLSSRNACSLGPLTQRLVSALIEDKKTNSADACTPSEPSSPTAGVSPAGECVADNDRQHHVAGRDSSSSMTPSQQGKSNGCMSTSQRNWVISNTKMLETRIHQELIQLGLMDPEEAIALDDEDDDVLVELRRRQSELKAVSDYNNQLKATLLQRAEIEREKQVLREKVRKADAEVVECLKKVTASKQRKKPLTRKERDAAFQTLSQRSSLVKHLNQLEKSYSDLLASPMP